MTHESRTLGVFVGLLIACTGAGVAQGPITEMPEWRRNEPARPRPAYLPPPPGDVVLPRPEDAIVLFDGRDLSAWVTGPQAEPPRWKIENGYVEVVPGTGSIRTRQAFGDVQLHLEWAVPNPPVGAGDSGDSGVMLMGNYEIQIVDSFRRETSPADGMAASIYGLQPPLTGVARAPGEWQSYDVFFRAPRFSPDGKMIAAARITLLHNGVMVQNNEIVPGPTIPGRPAVHAAKMPLTLQGNVHPVRFRNIWIREVSRPSPPSGYTPTAASLPPA